MVNCQMRGRIHKLQAEFKMKLRSLRSHQLSIAAERASTAKLAWEDKVHRAREDKEKFLDGICNDCGLRPYRHGKKIRCGCDDKASIALLVSTLRKLAGICAPKRSDGGDCVASPPIPEFPGWNRGPEGFRKCSPASWDNSVRALEDG